MRAAAYKVDVAMQPPQARVSQAKLFFINRLNGHDGMPTGILYENMFIRRKDYVEL